MPRLWILKINKTNVDDLNERGRVAIGSDQKSSLEPDQLVLTKFIKGLGGEQANRVALYRIVDVEEETVGLEPVSDFNEQVTLNGDDWERIRFVPMSLRTMHVWTWNRTDDDRGLYQMVEAGDATREQVLDRCFVVRTESPDMAEEHIRDHLEVRPYDRFLCIAIGEEKIYAWILEADLEGNIGPLSNPTNNIPQQYELDLSDIEQATSRSGYVHRLWDYIRGVEDITEVPYEDLSFYDVLGFKAKVEAEFTNGDRPWYSSLWRGLMEWVEDDGYVARRRIVAERSRKQIQDLLAEDHLDKLTLEDFNRYVWKFGNVYDDEGNAVSDIHQYSPEELRERLESGGWTVTGQQTVGGGAGEYAPGLDGSDDEKAELMRRTLHDLLYSSDDLFANFESVLRAPNYFGENWATLILCMMHVDRAGIMNDRSRSGLRRLAQFLGTEDEWQDRISGDYREFNRLLYEVRDAPNSVFGDLLEVDAFLNRVSDLGQPEYWKVALAINAENKDEAQQLYERAIEHGFVALLGEGEGDDNLQRFRQIKPGDYIVMHRSGKIASVGRCVRPFYELGPEEGDALDAKWARRIAVHWLDDDTTISSSDFLTADQRYKSVAPLSVGQFWWIAEPFSDPEQFDRVLNPPDEWEDLIEPLENGFCSAVRTGLPGARCSREDSGLFRVTGSAGNVTVAGGTTRRAGRGVSGPRLWVTPHFMPSTDWPLRPTTPSSGLSCRRS